ncbi:MAG: GNAT family N-acetyltransferase [Gemmatimonadetes bacterium]|nr:GNAT family N-acetyltransferase [Gemmatimonadota bacterium]
MAEKYSFDVLPEAEYSAWDELVAASPQGTVFNTTAWYRILAKALEKEWIVYGCRKKDELAGGVISVRARKAAFDCLLPPLFTPYQGIVLRAATSPRVHANVESTVKVVGAIESGIRARHPMAVLVHHPALPDLRPLVWSGWEHVPRYTFRLELQEPENALAEFRYDIRKRIKSARESGIEVRKTTAFGEAVELYASSYARHKQAPPVPTAVMVRWFEAMAAAGLAAAYEARGADGRLHGFRIIVFDGPVLYDWMAGADPDLMKHGGSSLILFHLYEEFHASHEALDFMGANTESIAAFKAGFGAPLTPYWESRHFRSGVHRAAFQAKEIVSRFTP